MTAYHTDIFQLNDKHIWVFGGAGYLGQATVLMLSRLGAKVLCVDLDNRAEIFVRNNNLTGVTPASLDIRETGACEQFVKDRIAERGVPDGYVNLTTATTAKKMEDLTAEDFDSVNHGGLTSTFILTRAIGSQMAVRNRGSIVLFSSMYGTVSPYPEVYQEPMNKNPLEYGIGKAGITQMTRYLAVHWGKSNVRCNCISPGPFPNPEVQKTHGAFVERLAGKSPLGRIGQAEEIAGSVAFLLSGISSYITGHNLAVDGGWTCW
ncbi:Dihydroanticapsin 7-dehydrogenase [Dyadobacter sp. CECT 9275]|uniref:Dihydroanticapsin 7-dehydrogenase n=1 Tax=Dyadobacter helix TaxID=2822344 RepID=A0A916JGJ1_9BACT|nr:SDR family oxidoreductase [Dyadobacter sp. CECT 9275]CAG5002396.1 Dihydroanticapsin 7-dehydrogenase [Dyadobacter sp. CECT 9275]